MFLKKHASFSLKQVAARSDSSSKARLKWHAGRKWGRGKREREREIEIEIEREIEIEGLQGQPWHELGKLLSLSCPGKGDRRLMERIMFTRGL